MMEDEKLGFLDIVEREGLQHEEGSLFSYLIRCMNTARKLGLASELTQFTELSEKIKKIGRASCRERV